MSKQNDMPPIIDCDVHHGDMTRQLPELFPYMPRHYVEYIKDFGPLLPGLGYTNVPPATNATRHDLWEVANGHAYIPENVSVLTKCLQLL